MMLVTSMEKQVLFKRLCQRNAIRREIGIQPMDIPIVFQRRLRMMTQHRYIELLEPYLVAAFGSVEWPVEPTLRLRLAVKQHQLAIDILFRDIGVADPREKHADVTVMIERLVPTSTTDTVVAIPSCTCTNAHQIEPGGP